MIVIKAVYVTLLVETEFLVRISNAIMEIKQNAGIVLNFQVIIALQFQKLFLYGKINVEMALEWMNKFSNSNQIECSVGYRLDKGYSCAIILDFYDIKIVYKNSR